MTNPSKRACTMCQQVHGENGWEPRHDPVYGEGERLPSKKKDKQRPPQVGVAMSALPFDPVLRQALVDKGVLTPEDLRLAQEKITAVTGMVLGGVSHGAFGPAETGTSGAASGD